MLLLRQSLFMLFGLAALCGAAYPAAVTGIAKSLFPAQAEGSLIKNDKSEIVGSALVGQEFTSPKYFWGRPSATSPAPYNATASGGSNLGNNAPALLDAVKTRVAALKDADPENNTAVPVDLVTASGSGLDPHISPAAAYYQAGRVAKARNIPLEDVNKHIETHTQGRAMGIFGEPVVNVLELNMALDKI